MELHTAVRHLSALAQDSRLAIFRLLVQAGPDGLRPADLADRLGLPPATLSFHLKELNGAGLVTARQDGRYIHYSPDFTTMNALIAYLTENCCAGHDADCAAAPRQDACA